VTAVYKSFIFKNLHYVITERHKYGFILSEVSHCEYMKYFTSLFNMATVHTLRNGGSVFLAEPGEMPMKDTEINALLRY